MFDFSPKYNSFDKIDAKTHEKQVNAAYYHGNEGNETNAPIVALRTKTAADIAALERTQQMLSYLSGTNKIHQRLRDHLVQERRWLAHYDKCIDANKRGYEKLKLSAKGLVEEAFAAGKLAMEKDLKVKLDKQAADFKAKQDDKPKQGNENGQFQSRHDGNRQQNQDRQQSQDQNRDKNKPQSATFIVEKMVVKKNKKDKKKKGTEFFQLTPRKH